MRQAVLRAYGGEQPTCACCGESKVEFLTLDHIEGGGGAHRARKSNQGVYHELRRAGYPAGFRVLCFNCNMARGAHGECPHVEVLVALTNRLGSRRDAPSGPGLRRCTGCREDLPRAAFYGDKGTRSGLQSRCRACTKDASRSRLRMARIEALSHYSRGSMVCRCCGQNELKFLALDHEDGAAPRMPGGKKVGNAFFAWLKRQGFPAGLQVLCHNCNCAKRDKPDCPHKLNP